MTNTALRACYLDASALVKLYVQEVGSDKLKRFLDDEPTQRTTLFCYFEALSILKGKWAYGWKEGEVRKNKLLRMIFWRRKISRKKITKDHYLRAAYVLSAQFRATWKRAEDLDFLSRTDYMEAHDIAKKYDKLDLSDAFQILSIQTGLFSNFIDESKSLFITADKHLTEAARHEKINTWDLLREPAPER